MQTFTIDLPQPYLIPPLPVVAVLVGCGGTGSVVAQHLARLAWHLRDQGGPPLHLCFIDGDRVETKNIGRQWFCPAERGQNKAQTLATRLSAALGLSIDTIPQMATGDMLTRYLRGCRTQALSLVIGAVDTVVARRELVQTLRDTDALWLDGGNHEASGQVAIGNVTRRTQLRGAFQAGLCTALPAPSLVYPNL
ncbi:MAG: hypothetical protein HC828_06840, partial [Blastochloris sp.]|nr:hypothetical protein [Blastochloris sp.]